ncbi:MAG: 4a-hydroxytetrahydrobiopterin dehydratase, partial [Actinomycetia bacterium]|nr:4a-hydroxytetrahydrobiopterin dehydratase [Actinomycetes bacterium]
MADPTFTRTEAQETSPNWRLLLGRLMLSVEFPDFVSALTFVNAVGDVAELLDHHPDIDLRWGRVVLAVASHDVGGLTERDRRFTAAIDELLPEHEGTVQHDRLTELEVAIDTMDVSAIRPFWAAVLGFEEDGEDAVADPNSRLPGVWFQQLDEDGAERSRGRNRIHIDVTVAHDEAQA